MIRTKDNQPLLVMWIGNFYEPEYSSEQAMRKALSEIKTLGFNAFCMDSKQSEDFQQRFDAGISSRYVSMQEYAMSIAKKIGLTHMHLALYCCGDNLYWVGLREFPPVYGEEAAGVDGNGLRTYKYWSPIAQESMIKHCCGLLNTYRENHCVITDTSGADRLPVGSMFDPCLQPSFDEEGRTRYLSWLERKHGKIEVLNERYGTAFRSFADLRPPDYWYKPETIDLWSQECPDENDFAQETPDLLKWIDNQLWRVEETVRYFKEMQERFAQAGVPFFLMPTLQQWKIFFNDFGLDSCTTFRAVDPWRIGPYVDVVTYNTYPADCHSRANPYVISAEMSIMRSANEGRDVIGGLDILRYIQDDVYNHVSPAEAIATVVAHGGTGLFVYGYNGLDDGGAFAMMPPLFKESVRAGLDWFKAVAPQIDGHRTREIAILFPLAMSLVEPTAPGTAAADHRQDLLGWFQHLCDLGWMVDIVHPDQVKAGVLGDYSALIIPKDTCYKHIPDQELECAIAEWLRRGGVVLHGPRCDVVGRLAPPEHPLTEVEYIAWEPRIVPEGIDLAYFESDDPVACYESGKPAISRTRVGEGCLYSLGFDVGYAYVKKDISGIPPKYGRLDMYALPLVDLVESPISAILNGHKRARYPACRGIEYADFGDRLIIVNHNSIPYRLVDTDDTDAVRMYEVDGNMLVPHSAVMLLGAKAAREQSVS